MKLGTSGWQIAGFILGFLTTVITSTAADYAMRASGIFLPGSMSTLALVIAFSYRLVFNTAGCYVSAKLAPEKKMRNALILGSFGCVLGITGTIIMWNQTPAWYSLGIVLTALPCAWLGGKMAER